MFDTYFGKEPNPEDALVERIDKLAKGSAYYLVNRKTKDDRELTRSKNVIELFADLKVNLSESQRYALAVFAAQKQKGYENIRDVLYQGEIPKGAHVNELKIDGFRPL